MPKGIYQRLSAEDRFWAKVNKKSDDECWEWQGSCHSNGYGTFWFQRADISAHRFSFLLHHGEISEGMFILHSCDNKPCVNPNHLSMGTPLDNSADMCAKGRKPRGTKSGCAKLTDEKVMEIRELFATGDYTLKEMGVLFDINFSHVHRIINFKSWAHIK